MPGGGSRLTRPTTPTIRINRGFVARTKRAGAASGNATAMTLLLPFREFIFGFLQLLLEGRVGVQRSDHRGADDARRIDIALPVIAADHPALAELIAALQNFVLPLRVDLRQHGAVAQPIEVCPDG